jgi:hypothetical protein
MNTKKLFIPCVFALGFLIFSSFKGENRLIENNTTKEYYQQGLIVYATFIGADATGYNFEKKAKNGKIVTFSFQEIKPAALKKFDLKSEALKGTHFKITFDKDDNFTEEVHDDKNTITDLEKY